jgi:small subunit ribosomal protein S18
MQFDKRRRRPGRFADLRIGKIDYKDDKLLRRFLTENGKIIPRRISGVCSLRKLTSREER